MEASAFDDLDDNLRKGALILQGFDKEIVAVCVHPDES